MLELLIYSLATWRIASLFVNEVGPGKLFVTIREWAGIGHDEFGKTLTIPDEGFFAGVFSCVWCCSLWIGLGWMVLGWWLPLLGLKFATVFAFSAGAILIQCWIERE